MKILALIPARKGSKGIKNKNFKKFNSKPLIWWTIKSSRKSKFLDKVVVSTDCEKIKNFSLKNKVEAPFLRPKKISNDSSTAKQVIDHTLKYYKEKKNYYPDAIIYLQPTSPLRETSDIDNCCKIFLKYKPDILLSVNRIEHQKNPENIFQITKKKFLKRISKKKIIPLRQKKKIYFAQNGPAILMINCKLNLKNNSKIVGYEMDKLKSIDIDDKIDFKLSEIIQRKFRYN